MAVVCRVLEPKTLMYRVLHKVVLFVLLVHMVFGCCLHHAHSHPLQPADEPCVETTCPWHHGQDDGNGQPPQHRPGGNGCEGGRCVFTRPESGDTPQASLGAPCVPSICTVPGPSALRGIDTADTAPDPFGPPVRLHLLNQALLL